MPKPIAVNLPDAHLSWSTWADYPDLNQDSLVSFEQAVNCCLRLDCDLLLPGDIMNKSVQDDGVILSWLAFQFGRLRAAGRSVWFIVGQHDRTRRVQWLTSLGMPNVIHAHGKKFRTDVSGPLFYGLDFQPMGNLQKALDDIPSGAEILMCHQVWGDLMGEQTKPEGVFADVPAVSMIITGDFHGHKTMESVGKDGQKLLVVSSGATHMRSLTEDHQKFFHVIYDDLSVQSFPLQTRPCYRYQVFTDTQLRDLLLGPLLSLGTNELLPEAIRKPIIHLEHDPLLENVRKRTQDVLGGKAFLFDRPMKPRPVDEEVDQERIHELIDGGLVGCLELEAEPGTPVYTTVLRLLKTPAHMLKREVEAIAMERLSAPEEEVL